MDCADSQANRNSLCPSFLPYFLLPLPLAIPSSCLPGLMRTFLPRRPLHQRSPLLHRGLLPDVIFPVCSSIIYLSCSSVTPNSVFPSLGLNPSSPHHLFRDRSPREVPNMIHSFSLEVRVPSNVTSRSCSAKKI